ncbi:MAG: methyltransferase domain-containing protein [Betaproteobacteria bacterium]|nr:methyltransferase domain-containing protein [Betaproteobacteria bacterium]
MQTPAGLHALSWEQAQLDRVVADIFGYHAVQLGLRGLAALRHNRMPHRWLALDEPDDADDANEQLAAQGEAGGAFPPLLVPGPCVPEASLVCDYTDLPLAAQSLDLVVLPHTLEVASDPYACLREADRVLVAGGQVVITGFNSLSLWGARQFLARLGGQRYLPQSGELISPRRVRDWLRLLSFEVTAGAYGCWRPPLQTQAWLERWRFMDKAGERWWPMLGGMYVLVATKRVRAMRLVGKAWQPNAAKAHVARPVAHRRTAHSRREPGGTA